MTAAHFSLEGFAAHGDDHSVYVRAEWDLWTKFQEGGILAQECKESHIDLAMSIGTGGNHATDLVLAGSDVMGLYDALCAARDTLNQAIAAYESTPRELSS